MDRATNKDGQAIVINMAPDVCLTPMGGVMVPVPYNITCQFDVAVMTSSNVNYQGLPAFTMASRLPTVKGDEPGVGGGVTSGVNLGFCKPTQHSGTYRVNGQWVIRHGDQMDMNCAGPDGVGNTIGKITYVGVGPVGALPDGEEDEVEEVEPDPDDPQIKAAEEELKKAEEELAAAKREAALLAAETALDIAGIFDPTPTSDTAAAGLALNRGDYVGAGLNLLSWIPYVGDAVAKPIKGWKMTRAGAKVLEKIQKIQARLQKLKDALKALKDKLKKKVTKKKKPDKPGPQGDGGHIPPKPRTAFADDIANGHAYDKHVVKKGEFPEIKSRKEFADLIDKTVQNPTHTRQLSNGRTAYYDANTNTLVLHNPGAADAGTAFRPANGLGYVNGLN